MLPIAGTIEVIECGVCNIEVSVEVELFGHPNCGHGKCQICEKFVCENCWDDHGCFKSEEDSKMDIKKAERIIAINDTLKDLKKQKNELADTDGIWAALLIQAHSFIDGYTSGLNADI